MGSMSFGGFERGIAPSQPMAEINVTPLVDVVLVLLVVFIITAPLLAYSIRLDLPDARAAPAAAAADAITLSLDADGIVYWNNQRVDEAELGRRLEAAAHRTPLPELQLRADRATRYERVLALMSAAQQAGLERIGFVTQTPSQAPVLTSPHDAR
jgi:biopolymer transport protein ExbD